ncbi:type II secretion system inner membrane protein GspF [Parvularcula lutaonensis]|uniref:General secretion pathway protein F n=1 Tax=Parvularcula lutaonensis TaxID=491923 RepID=A0ABV7MDC5_9PROT|nr:type II secretion system inner membrane protein GspF [Parvularcula lutaonensis]GGY52699.1 type II secretion system protein F [Parvularcula lutaonensis]
MTAFRYEAVDAAGRKKRGTVEAENLRRARREVIASGLTPLSVGEAQERAFIQIRRGPPPPKKADVIAATRQLATLVEAAMPLEEALAAVAQQMEGTVMARVLTAVRGRVIEGWRMSKALGEHPKAFSPLYRGIVASGETSGDLGAVLSRLADMQERNQQMAQKAQQALIYPACIFVVAIGVVWALMSFVVPRMVEQFSRMDGVELPLPTRLVIGASEFITNWGWLAALIVLLMGVGYWQARKREGARLLLDRWTLKVPVLGPLMRELDAARFARTLSTLFAAGAPLLEALEGARRTLTNSYIQKEIGTAVNAVREGASLAVAIRRAAVFPPIMASMIAAGERSGALPDMLSRTATQMEGSFETATATALRLLEPAVIVLLGLIVMLIVLSIMLPILQINNMALG